MVFTQGGIHEHEERREGQAVGGIKHAVDKPLALFVAASEVDFDRITPDRNLAAHPNRDIQLRAVIIRGRLPVIDPVGNLLNRGPHGPLRPVKHLLQTGLNRLLPVFVEKSRNPLLAYPQRGNLGIVVDPNPLRPAHIVQYQLHHIFPLPISLHHLDPRYAHALSVNVISIRKISARIRSAGVHLMSPAHRKEHKLSLVKDRAVKSPVGQMAAVTLVGVVHQDDVAGIQVSFELVQNVLNGKLAAQVLNGQADRNGHRARLGIPDPNGDVMELSDQIILGRAVDHVPHLFADALQGMPHGRKGHGIYPARTHSRLPPGPRARSSP